MHEFTSVPMSIDPHASRRVEERLEFQVPGIANPSPSERSRPRGGRYAWAVNDR